MKRRHLLLVALSLIISICMCFCMTACNCGGNDDETPTALTTPVVTIDDSGVASWEAVEYASGYVYKINDGNEVETAELSKKLSAGQTIAVKAIGDGESYTDSAWSEAKTYTAKTPDHEHNWSTTYVNDGASGHHQTCDGCDELKSEPQTLGEDGRTCTTVCDTHLRAHET